MNQFNLIQSIAIWVIPLIFAITVHEVSHGWVANKFGDPTAKMLGRLTLNPVKHIDPIGTLLVPALLLFFSGFKFAFGWAKPVPVTWQNLRQPRRDMALVALAGPLANLVMALFWGIIAKLGLMSYANTGTFALALMYMGDVGILINLILMTLNLLPIPPLDGSRILSSLLPPHVASKLGLLEPYGFFIILGLLVTGALQYILFPPVFFMYAMIRGLFGLG